MEVTHSTPLMGEKKSSELKEAKKGSLLEQSGKEHVVSKQKASPEAQAIIEKAISHQTQAPQGTTTSTNKVTFKEKVLSQNEQEIVTKLLKQGVPKEIAEKMAKGCSSGWKDLVIEKAVSGRTVFQQNHSIKGLKIYRDSRTGHMVADFASVDRAEGGYKRAKDFIRLDDQGQVGRRIRLTKKRKSDKGYTPEELKKRFDTDIGKELNARESLEKAGKGPIPNLLKIIPIQYISEKGSLKIRYETELCDEVLTKVVDRNIEEDGSYSLRHPERTIEALGYCRDTLEALKAMHERGFVHGDIKSANILIREKKGLLADLGLLGPIDDKESKNGNLTATGSTGIEAPEIALGDTKKACSKDMFSFGMVLLEQILPNAAEPLEELRRFMEVGENLTKILEEAQKEKEALEREEKKDPQPERAAQIEQYEKVIQESKERGELPGLDQLNQKLAVLLEEKKTLEDDLAKQFDPEKKEKLRQCEESIAQNAQQGEALINGYMSLLTEIREDLNHRFGSLGQLIARLLDPDPTKRPSAQEAAQALDEYLKLEDSAPPSPSDVTPKNGN